MNGFLGGRVVGGLRANLGIKILKALGGVEVWFIEGGMDGRGFEVGWVGGWCCC